MKFGRAPIKRRRRLMGVGLFVPTPHVLSQLPASACPGFLRSPALRCMQQSLGHGGYPLPSLTQIPLPFQIALLVKLKAFNQNKKLNTS